MGIPSNVQNNIIDIKFYKKQRSESVKHSKSYSRLLDIYVDSVQENIKIKRRHKNFFFNITMGILLIIVIVFILTLFYAVIKLSKFDNLNSVSLEAILSIITVLAPSMTSLIVAFIKIPEIIAEYLFNIQEDNYMNSVIKNIQDYDKSMFDIEQKINKDLKKERSDEIPDDGIEDSPMENTN
ncbi:MAG: hypothetical protein HDR71_16955 [Lachnospiraceae bacterium]|nr:hypothetical protein [Lachnospiraceae bacterium]